LTRTWPFTPPISFLPYLLLRKTDDIKLDEHRKYFFTYMSLWYVYIKTHLVFACPKGSLGYLSTKVFWRSYLTIHIAFTDINFFHVISPRYAYVRARETMCVCC
jgi:hypothetical protein